VIALYTNWEGYNSELEISADKDVRNTGTFIDL
jgi:hypothetical protein